jgi:hypothetical protein
VPYSGTTDVVQWFDLEGQPVTMQQFRAKECDLWDTLGYYFNDCSS